VALLMSPAVDVAGARTADSILHSKRLWATVNVCDTVGHPDSLGIRGSMPGSGDKREEMFMRFQVQYFKPSDGQWHDLGTAGDSGWVDVGNARPIARQAGRTFTVTPPRPGTPAYLLRGVVTFEWREDGITVRRAHKRTNADHPNTAGADPPTASAATCSVT
jgi:hypothetical protein